MCDVWCVVSTFSWVRPVSWEWVFFPIGVSWEFDSPVLATLASLVGLIGARLFWFVRICCGISGWRPVSWHHSAWRMCTLVCFGFPFQGSVGIIIRAFARAFQPCDFVTWSSSIAWPLISPPGTRTRWDLKSREAPCAFSQGVPSIALYLSMFMTSK